MGILESAKPGRLSPKSLAGSGSILIGYFIIIDNHVTENLITKAIHYL
jgi:hypothetical protein